MKRKKIKLSVFVGDQPVICDDWILSRIDEIRLAFANWQAESKNTRDRNGNTIWVEISI